MDLTIVSIIFGGVLLTAVVIKFLQKDVAKNTTLTCFLTVFGFALVSSPAWTSISIKSKDTELSLIRESTKQMDDYVRILNSYNDSRQGGWTNQKDERGKWLIDIRELASQLDAQKNKIESALAKGDVNSAIAETKAGSELIGKIANSMTPKG